MDLGNAIQILYGAVAAIAAFLAVVLYVHVVCDFLRDLGIA